MAPNPNLVSLYRGAIIGQALSKQLGEATATGGDISTAQRTAYIQSGIATGKIQPASLSPSDSALLSGAVKAGTITAPHVPSSSSGGLLDTLLTPVKIITNTAGDLVHAAGSLPAGIFQVGKSAFKTGEELFGGAVQNKPTKPTSGPDLLGLAGDIAKTTARDFTHFDPMHPLYPALDLAAVVSGGASLAARTGSALSRVAAEGRAVEAANAAGNASRVTRLGTIGRSPTLQKLGDLGQKVNLKIAGSERPAVPITSRTMPEGVQVPQLPLRYYSLSPFRRLFVEKPIEALFQSKPARMAIPGMSEGTTLMDLRGRYHIRKEENVLRGRASGGSAARAAIASRPFNEAMQHLIDTSTNDTQALEKFNALVLMRMLGAETMTPTERLDVLEEYRNKVLATGQPQFIEGVPRVEETKAIREYNRKLTGSAEYRKYFTEPDAAMLAVKDAWDRSILDTQKAFNLDPNEILQRSLGPAAHIRDLTPEELLREQPEMVQATMNFARGAHEIEQALRASGGGYVPEMALASHVATFLPGTATLADKTKLLQDAIDSLRADIAGEHTPRELLNNAESTGYLPGKNLAQKVAQALPTRLGVEPHIAEPFATGGLTNYFPQVSALNHMHVRANGGPISRRLEKLIKTPLAKRGWDVGKGPESGKLGLHEFKRENTARLLKANTLGVGPFASFLEEADMSAFMGGVDRRDPVIMVRHISQRERVLTHRLLSEPMIERIALKDAEGNVITVANDQEKAEVIGSTVAAQKYTIISPRALQALIQTEDKAALDVAGALKEEGEVTPALLEHIDSVVDESAQMAVRELANEAITAKGKGIIVPNAYVQNLIKHARIIDSSNRVGHMWQAFINKWRTAVLAYMPSWLLRTSVGHGFIMFLSGVWNPRHYLQSVNYFKDGYRVPGTEAHITQGLNREAPLGVEQGMPHTEFGQIGQKQYMKNMIAPAITGTVHKVMNFQRRAAFLSMFNRVVKQHFAELGEAFEFPHGLKNAANLDKAIADHPEWVHQALNELDRVSYTFGQMSAWERRLAKNILPFWGWYRFVTKFVWSLPMNYPGRAYAVTRLGQVGEAAQGQLGPMPDWLRASIMFDTHNLAAVHYMSMLGLNPLGDVADPAAGFQGLVRLGQMSPVMQAALEGAGYNTMTGGLESADPATGIVEVNGRFINLHTGKEYDSLDQASVQDDILRFFGGLARSFPEIRIGELAATKGYPVFPESIPFFYERRIPTTNVKNVSVPGILAQYAGVAPKTYDLQKYQINLLKDIRRAISTSAREKVKEKALP